MRTLQSEQFECTVYSLLDTDQTFTAEQSKICYVGDSQGYSPRVCNAIRFMRSSSVSSEPYVRSRYTCYDLPRTTAAAFDCFVSSPPEAIAAYVFAQHFFIYWLVGWLVYAIRLAGTVVHLGDLVLGREVTQVPAGGCRANNVR